MNPFLALLSLALAAFIILGQQPPFVPPLIEVVETGNGVDIPFLPVPDPWAKEYSPNGDCGMANSRDRWHPVCDSRQLQVASYHPSCRVIHCVRGQEFEGDPHDDLIPCLHGQACIPEGAYEIRVCATLKNGRKYCAEE